MVCSPHTPPPGSAWCQDRSEDPLGCAVALTDATGHPHPQVPPLRSPGRCQRRAPRVLSQVDTRARAWALGGSSCHRELRNILRERTTHIRMFLVEGNSK